jgi:LacI family transcriptional regulator/LacI family repressor for deo operon, udp, cdd, tsx, nupC, and nupG
MHAPAARATIQEVAERAGVSVSTVSAVLNDKPSVKDSTREQVLAAIQALNYRPRPAIRRPAGPNGVRTIGFLLREPANPYYAEVVEGAESYLGELGYRILVGASFGISAREREIVEMMRLKDFDGLLLTPVLDRHADLAHLFELRRRNIRFVLLEAVHGIQASLVVVDNVAGAKMGVRHLIDLGHTRIVHFAGPPYGLNSDERIAGVRAAYSESHLVFSDELVVRAGDSLTDGYTAALAYFRDLPAAERPTGVTCYNDLVALGVCRALAELGVAVPRDVSVVGYDDLPLAEFVTPSLTSVRVPKREVGRIAAELLHEEIEHGPAAPPRKVYLQAELVARASSCPYPFPTSRHP